MFVADKTRNTNQTRRREARTPLRPDDLAALGIEPMSARSVIASALLGTHPPALPGRALIALTELFGIRPGTARTSMSRMVATGELASDDSVYRLTGRLLERQHEQDTGRTTDDAPWDGDWITVVAESDRRSMAERRSFRDSMVGSRLAELRPDIWMRPANTSAPPRAPGVLITRGPLECDDVGDLVRRLWPLDELEAEARRLADALTRQRSAIEHDDITHLPSTFMVSAAAVRFLRIEPQLPEELAPNTWTARKLRSLYDDVNREFRHQLNDFFAAVD